MYSIRDIAAKGINRLLNNHVTHMCAAEYAIKTRPNAVKTRMISGSNGNVYSEGDSMCA